MGQHYLEISLFSSEPLVKVEDLESRQLVEPGQPGELLLKGPQVKKTPTKTKTPTETKTKKKGITQTAASVQI